MTRTLKYTFCLFALLFHAYSIAETSINWNNFKNTQNNQQEIDISINQGAFITTHEELLLIGSGIGQQTNKKIVEQLIPTDFKSPYTLTLLDPAKGDVSRQSTIKELLPYSAIISHEKGVYVIGGVSPSGGSDSVGVLQRDQQSAKYTYTSLPSLPITSSSVSAVIVDNNLYVLTGSSIGDNRNYFYRFDLNNVNNDEVDQHSSTWQMLASLPNPPDKALTYRNGIKLVVQNDGRGNKIYAIGGYTVNPDNINSEVTNQNTLALKPSQPIPEQNVWLFDPADKTDGNSWEFQGSIDKNNQSSFALVNVAIALGQSHILAFMNNGKLFSYNVITKSWANYQQEIDSSASNLSALLPMENIQSATWLHNNIYALTTSKIDNIKHLPLWQLDVSTKALHFGWQNMTVLVIYLLFVVAVGLFFMFKNRNTNDYFRGGQSIPWWAAACSIYATMLSSLTYVALPAIVYQTDWLLLIGIWMIIIVAPVAIYVAMPFFRQIDATSAYEYLSKRFNMPVRLFASGLFTLFHIGRMGIVMALTALALAAVTPLSATDSVLLMGILCLIYCTLGGIEAVIWTDTLQTVVLLIGAFVCFVTIVMGIDGGISELISIGLSDNKFTMVKNDFSLDSIMSLSIWVIVLGGIGQNISSYTADQAVVQRYMVTSDPKEASKSIWANAIIAVPSVLLFFCIGTGLYAFYQLHPEKLDPMIQIDQIFPTFIATELPLGLAGLIVAGIFAAAQSTVSTSMNSIATTIVTDFIRPFKLIKTEKGFMSAARWLTFLMGTLGTLAGLIFINPEIRSLMEAYFKVIGMFMGALGGLFVLGALTKKANSVGAIIGLLSGVGIMIWAWQSGWANGYLYATIGILSCLIIGYVASICFPGKGNNLDGLTLYSMNKAIQTPSSLTIESGK